MFAWLVLAVVVLVFASIMIALWVEAFRPLDETDEYCARVDEALRDGTR
jgi:hypothetical protein